MPTQANQLTKWVASIVAATLVISRIININGITTGKHFPIRPINQSSKVQGPGISCFTVAKELQNTGYTQWFGLQDSELLRAATLTLVGTRPERWQTGDVSIELLNAIAQMGTKSTDAPMLIHSHFDLAADPFAYMICVWSNLHVGLVKQFGLKYPPIILSEMRLSLFWLINLRQISHFMALGIKPTCLIFYKSH